MTCPKAKRPTKKSSRSIAHVWTVLALMAAAAMEFGIVAIAKATEWPSSAFYTVSALALVVFVAIAAPIIEPPRERHGRETRR